MTDEEWQKWYLPVVSDSRFKLFGLSRQDILDLRFCLDCWKKTPQQLRQEVAS